MRIKQTLETSSRHDRSTPEALRAAWQALAEGQPKLRIRDAAQQLTVSEAQLLALDCGTRVTRLAADWAELVAALPKLGSVMALTRNDLAVHERHGRHGPDQAPENRLELRLFPALWRFGFAVVESGHGGERHSLQFFDGTGSAVHKVYLTENSQRPAYESLVERYATADQSPRQVVESRAPQAQVAAEPGRYPAGASRRDGSRIRQTRLLSPTAAEQTLNAAARAAIPIEVAVGNRGAHQAYSGLIHTIRRTGPWINVLDDDFSLHLRDECLASSWLVAESSDDTIDTRLELFDDQDRLVAHIAGARRHGQREPDAWRDLLGALPGAGEAP